VVSQLSIMYRRIAQGEVFDRAGRMAELDASESLEDREPRVNPLGIDLSHDRDVTMEQILENINHTPLGRVLKRIASLPELRQQKVLRLRRQITAGRYDLSRRLDEVLDQVLEDLIT
jgi:hypothetical protein